MLLNLQVPLNNLMGSPVEYRYATTTTYSPTNSNRSSFELPEGEKPTSGAQNSDRNLD